MTDIKAIDKQYVANTYARFPVELVSGKGSLVYDEKGKEYIDMGSGIGVTAFGIADEEWQKAVIEQLGKLQHMSNLYYTQPCAILAKMLCEMTGMKKVFFTNSGAEANECVIKAARKYAFDKKGPDYYTIVTLENSFHGRTITTLAATGQEHYHELFQPLTPGFVYAKANDFEDVKAKALENKAAAIMMECIQGEGGVIPLEPDFVKAVADFAKKEDILLIFDEVQTGNGRTGELYAYMNYGVEPDLVSTAKGIAGGLPLGAALMGEKTEFSLGYGDHGSTFGGNPIVCAGANEVMKKVADDSFLRLVAAKGDKLRSCLLCCGNVASVTGLGMMLGIQLRSGTSAEVAKACLDRGLLVLTAKEKVRLLPPLTITDQELSDGLKILWDVLS